MQYREPLPPDCPPPSALGITEQTIRYRLLETTIPRPVDFDSYVRRNGRINRQIRRTPCEQSGVSLFVSLGAVPALLTGSLNQNRRWQSIGELTLSPGAGKLNPVEPKGHQTWWPAQDFDPVNNCQVIL